MSIKPETLQEICNLASKQVQDLYPHLQLLFVPHESGRFHDVITAKEYQAFKHPAAKTAHLILEKSSPGDQSGFLGLAVNRKKTWLGLGAKDSILALFNINSDEFSDAPDLRRAVYHMVWHALDLLGIRQRPEYAAKFRTGPMVPKRSPMNLARLNLQADTFAAVLCSLLGDEDALPVLAKRRAEDSLTAVPSRRAEDFPFVIAVEAANYAYQQLLILKPVRAKYMYYARHLAVEVGRAFDDKTIIQWWKYSEPAQDMAWRNFTRELILGCAIFTSEDPFVRTTGHLIADTTGIEPAPAFKAGTAYNAFTMQERNQMLHREIMEKAFEEAAALGLKEESGSPFITMANEQNEHLADGNILGWCANALQAAARAFDNAISSGISSPLAAARLEFEGTKDSTNWDALKKFGDTIVSQKRKGFAVTLGSVVQICGEQAGLNSVMESVRSTMKDPGYLNKLAAANDLSYVPAGLAPSAPAAAPKTPAPSHGYTPQAPLPPGLGGSSRQRPITRQTQDQQGKDEDRAQ